VDDLSMAGRSNVRDADRGRVARGDLYLAESKLRAMRDRWPEPRLPEQDLAMASVAADIERLRVIVASLPERPASMPPGVELPHDWQQRRSQCRSCGAPVIWGTYPSGKRAPFDPDGTNHFATCPQRREWRKP